ncbi:hypothetical protein ACIBHX_22765 [Nonomuraea sp. NPDC050536]|uniref:hypothetical protein n=1 Tax=Nonomuraea sp. NPDC050536 TaxID=3364366 RepID=UPI0037CC4646
MKIAWVAGTWSMVLTAFGGYWALGGAGFPLGRNDWRAAQVGSVFGRAESLPLSVGMVAVGLAGVVAAWALTRGSRAARIFAWILAVGLVVVVPDVRVMQNLVYALMGYTGLWDGALAFMLFSIAGGVLWAWAAVSAGAVAMPKIGSWAAYAAAVLALPYGASRLAWAMGIPLGVTKEFLRQGDPTAGAGALSEVLFAGLCFGGAVLTLGLVQRWGEVFPRWFPWVGGRRVPVTMAVVPGAAAAILLTQSGVRSWMFLRPEFLRADTWGELAPSLSWLPWGITLGMATYAYFLRRRLEQR